MREHSLDNLTEGGRGGRLVAVLEHTGHVVEISSIDARGGWLGHRISDSL